MTAVLAFVDPGDSDGAPTSIPQFDLDQVPGAGFLLAVTGWVERGKAWTEPTGAALRSEPLAQPTLTNRPPSPKTPARAWASSLRSAPRPERPSIPPLECIPRDS